MSAKNKLQPVIYWLAIAISGFHLWVNTFGTISEFWRNSFHLGFLGALGFFIYPFRSVRSSRLWTIIDVLLGILMIATAIYFILAENAVIERNLELTVIDSLVGAIAIILTLELGRRTSGIIIPFLSLFCLSYVFWWGKFINGAFYFRGMTLNRVLYRMCFTDEGLFGNTASISSTSVYMFVLFASFLLKSGGTDFIINLARIVTGKIAGGSGLVAVVASGLMGTISGSALANTVATGSITIPMMKKNGFKAPFAAGVEAAASVGGQLMPPVMGAGAFIMAQFTGLPYQTIIAVAFLPAVMYFATVGFYVWLEAHQRKLENLNETHTISLRSIGREGISFILPILLLIILLILGYTPTYAAGYSIIAVFISSWFSQHHPMGIRDVLDALALGAENMVVTGILLVAAGLIIGSIAMTGVSITFSGILIDWSGGNLFLALVMITLASLVLGMGLPVTAAYIMLAVLAAPALENMGVSLLAAHMIIFWLSQDSNITPPVCLAAYAAAGIAKTSSAATAIEAIKLAKGLYIIPLLFAFTPLIDGSWSEQLAVFAFGLVGLFVLTAAISGYFGRRINKLERIGLFGISLMFFYPNTLVYIVGLLLLLLWRFLAF
ncbi:MAG: TRAP transporter fused permease subunit [Xenococcaceae cyanobacterium MO_188.B32]|nr:TRAP transporter fused permease subunit [Xenococcaceae cyanobacterium MO_188.B32]